jgi:hypothetical protein
MSLSAGLIAVMVAERLLDFKENFFAFCVGFPLPEHLETLAANAAMCVSMTICRFAKDLH